MTQHTPRPPAAPLDQAQARETPSALHAALGLDAGPRPVVVAVVGGGGKTSLVYRLAREAADRGSRAVVAGTTRFTRAPSADLMPPLILAPLPDLPARIAQAWEAPGAPLALAAAGDDPQPAGRLAPLDAPTIDEIARLPGVELVALEADGSKLRPFKAPADHEPVIPPAATHVVAVVGLDALDRPLDGDRVHRPDRVRAILERAGVVSDQCTGAVIATVLASPDGGRKSVGDRPFTVVVNKTELDPPRARVLARHLIEAGVPRVVLTSLRDDADPVRATIEREQQEPRDERP